VSEYTDTELVAGVLAGDRDAFAAVYDRYADRLHDFCHSVLRDPHEAADAVQDTFVLAAQRLAQLNDPSGSGPGCTPSREAWRCAGCGPANGSCSTR
jgi:DNA-directed RNA polymerase specialized sigma24 family protein